jgi:hypothetical protein
MAKLSVASYSSTNGGYTHGDPAVSVLDFAFSAQETGEFSSNAVRYLRLCADAPCFYETGATPAAIGASSRYLPADTIEVLSLDPHTKLRVAAAAE